VRKGQVDISAISLSHRVCITRRHLQIALGLLWLLDARCNCSPS